MPYELSTFTLPCGARAGRIRIGGTLDEAESRTMMTNYAPGGPMYGLPTLVMMEETKDLTPESRAFYSAWKEPSNTEWYAFVITNAVLRVSISFIFRVAKTKRRVIFATEAEAVAWLDERARESR
ncbi:MAG TPA: hypothetical protein VIG99_06600 [Myxococcaceae bacterium]|jgi:hypothetical protein